MNKAELIEDFKSHLVETMNEDVYYQLKSWLEMVDMDEDEYSDILDYMCENLHGSLKWVD